MSTLKKSLIASSLVCLSLTGCSDDASVTNVVAQDTVAHSPIKQTLRIAKDTVNYLDRDIQDDVFYFVMPDRFANGNTDNDLGSKTLAISAGGFDPSAKGMYHGGDIQGLEQKLPYLESLGVTAIWLTPILRNQAMQGSTSGYHGYWVLDFTQIDPHLGSNDDLKSLIKAAHDKNIKIFFDIITNHTADVIKYTQCHGDDGLQWLVKGDEDCPFIPQALVDAGQSYTTVIPKGQESLKIPAWLNDPKYYHNQGDSNWVGESSVRGDFAGLDDVNTNDPQVVAGMIDIFTHLISEFKPDGFRIDTVKHVNTEFWSQFAPALVKHAKSEGIEKFFMFGEVYDSTSKVLSEYTTKGNMQSVLDFGFQSAVQQSLVDQNGTDVFSALFAGDSDYKDHDSDANQLLNFTGNHDMGRFSYFLKSSEHNYDEHQIIARNKLAHAMMYFMRGEPIIYYGDEQGFVGDGNDQASRQDMMPSKVASYNDDDLIATDATTAQDNFDRSHPFYQAFAHYADLYHQEPALRYGQHKTLYAQDTPGIFALSRTLVDGEQVVVVFNTNDNAEQVTLDANSKRYKAIYQAKTAQGGHQLDVSDKTLKIAVPALSFAVYKVI